MDQLPDQITQTGSMLAPDAAATATIANLGGLNRQITIPISENITIAFPDGIFLTGTASGTIVMTATIPPVPEP